MQNSTPYAAGQTFEQPVPEWLSLESNRADCLPDTMFSKDNMAVWTWLCSRGISNALLGLSQMTEQEIKLTSLDLKWLPVKDVAGLAGGPEATGIGIYLAIEGDATGHLLLMHDIHMAFELIDLQLGLPRGSTQQIDEMERSVLGEMGNITGSFFLNALADSTNLVLMPSPPAVVVDSVRAIMNIPLAFIMEEQDDTLVVIAGFRADGQQLDGTFMVLPTMDFMKTILKHSEI